jgi:hypothetical protein
MRWYLDGCSVVLGVDGHLPTILSFVHRLYSIENMIKRTVTTALKKINESLLSNDDHLSPIGIEKKEKTGSESGQPAQRSQLRITGN